MLAPGPFIWLTGRMYVFTATRFTQGIYAWYVHVYTLRLLNYEKNYDDKKKYK